MRNIPVNGSSSTFIIHIDQPTDRLSPLESGFDVGFGEMPAAFIPESRTMGMYGSEPISLLAQGCELRLDNMRPFNVNPISVGLMLDWSDLRYEEISLIGTYSIDCREMLIGEPLSAFLPESGQ
jgi:hypothetical protein